MANIKPKMKLYNGSEYHLLRFLGRHRNYLNSLILSSTNINLELDYDMEWLDFGYIKDTVFDKEPTGIEFLTHGDTKIYENVKKKWIQYWPQTGNSQNWDGVIYLHPLVPKSKKIEKWVVIEAKARLEELQSKTGAGKESRKIIEKAFKETKDYFGIQTKNNWLENYYQLANRLAFLHFMQLNNVDVTLLNIYFINGWSNDLKKNVTSKKVWEKKIKEEYDYLGINQKAKNCIQELFVNCNGNTK